MATGLALLEYLSFIRGSLYGDLIAAGIILLVTLGLIKVVDYIFKHQLKKYAAKTENPIDDALVHTAEKTVLAGVLLFGLHLALLSIGMINLYKGALQKIFSIIWILWGVFFAVRVVETILGTYHAAIPGISKISFGKKFVPIFRKITNIFIYVIAFMLILRRLGVDITPLVAGLGIGGLAIALALQQTLSNFFAGTYIMTDGSITMGDFIEIDDKVKGYIKEIGWRSTKIQTTRGNIIIIPNGKLSESIVMNYHEPANPFTILVPVGVSYTSDLEKVERVTIDVAKKVIAKDDGAVKEFEPAIRFNQFGDSNINFNVVLRVKKYTDQWVLTHKFIKALKKRYDKEKIEISWPVRKVYNFKGN